MKRISKRDMYNIIINVMETGESPVPPEDIIEFAKHEIELIDLHNAKAKKYKKNKVNDLLVFVETCLPDEAEMIDSIVTRVKGSVPSEVKIEVTRSKVIYCLNKLVADGKAIKVKGKNVSYAKAQDK